MRPFGDVTCVQRLTLRIPFPSFATSSSFLTTSRFFSGHSLAALFHAAATLGFAFANFSCFTGGFLRLCFKFKSAFPLQGFLLSSLESSVPFHAAADSPLMGFVSCRPFHQHPEGCCLIRPCPYPLCPLADRSRLSSFTSRLQEPRHWDAPTRSHALQSFIEPESWLASFEGCLPS